MEDGLIELQGVVETRAKMFDNYNEWRKLRQLPEQIGSTTRKDLATSLFLLRERIQRSAKEEIRNSLYRWNIGQVESILNLLVESNVLYLGSPPQSIKSKFNGRFERYLQRGTKCLAYVIAGCINPSLSKRVNPDELFEKHSSLVTHSKFKA